MVLCVMIGCSKSSGRDKGVSFPVITHKGKQEYKLTKKEKQGDIQGWSWNFLENYCISSSSFISGKPAYLYDEVILTGYLRCTFVMQRINASQAREVLKDGRRGVKRQKNWRQLKLYFYLVKLKRPYKQRQVWLHRPIKF